LTIKGTQEPKNDEYNQVNQSQLLPDLDIQVLTQYINYHDQYDGVTEFGVAESRYEKKI